MQQAALDFAAPVSVYTEHRAEQRRETARLESAADRVLALLRERPQTNLDLIDVCQRISGRIYDLRRRGYQIETACLEPGVFRYTLTKEPPCA